MATPAPLFAAGAKLPTTEPKEDMAQKEEKKEKKKKKKARLKLHVYILIMCTHNISVQ